MKRVMLSLVAVASVMATAPALALDYCSLGLFPSGTMNPRGDVVDSPDYDVNLKFDVGTGRYVISEVHAGRPFFVSGLSSAQTGGQYAQFSGATKSLSVAPTEALTVYPSALFGYKNGVPVAGKPHQWPLRFGVAKGDPYNKADIKGLKPTSVNYLLPPSVIHDEPETFIVGHARTEDGGNLPYSPAESFFIYVHEDSTAPNRYECLISGFSSDADIRVLGGPTDGKFVVETGSQLILDAPTYLRVLSERTVVYFTRKPF